MVLMSEVDGRISQILKFKEKYVFAPKLEYFLRFDWIDQISPNLVLTKLIFFLQFE